MSEMILPDLEIGCCKFYRTVFRQKVKFSNSVEDKIQFWAKINFDELDFDPDFVFKKVRFWGLIDFYWKKDIFRQGRWSNAAVR